MSGEDLDLKVSQETKSFTELMIWAGKNGQAESAKSLIESVQNQDWSAAQKACDKLEQYGALTDGVEKFAGHLDTLEKLDKALEVAEKVKDGDYMGASVQVGAEMIDGAASKFLQSQGPGGIALDFAAHAGGEYLAGMMDQYQAAQDQHVTGQADINSASVAVWQDSRDYLETGARERLEAGQSPADVQQWARDHIESHGAIYRDLENMDGNFGSAQNDRQVTDQLWIIDRTNDIAQELDDAQAEVEAAPERDDSQGESSWWKDRMEDLGELKDAVLETLTADQDEQKEASEPQTKVEAAAQEPVPTEAPPEAKVAEPVVPEPKVAEPEVAEIVTPEVEVTVVNHVHINEIHVIDAQPVEAPAVEETTTTKVDSDHDQLVEAYEIELVAPVANDTHETNEEPVEIRREDFASETKYLDALVSQMAREAEAKDSEPVSEVIEVELETDTEDDGDADTGYELYDGNDREAYTA